jgi:ATP-binding cassette, subfamily G (WHITE), member 2, PDR
VLFQTFDRLLLLGYGGKPMYFGEIGSGGTVVTGYFESHGARPCREQENPAEWLLDIVGAVVGSKNTKNWSEIWRNSTQKKEVKNHVADLTRELSALPTKQDDKARQEYAVSFIAQVWAVTLRTFEQDWRIPSYLYSKILLSTGTVRLPPLRRSPISTRH